MANYLGIDAQQQLFDHFVMKRFQGSRGAQEYARTLMDATAEAPLPEIEPNLFGGLARAAKNVQDVFFAGESERLGKNEKKLNVRWIKAVRKLPDGYGECDGNFAHVLPPETQGVKSALADMRTTYEEVFGGKPKTVQTDVPNATRFSPYWTVLEALLEPNYMGAEWQESWGEEGADSVHVPFPRIRRLYYVDEKNRVRAKKPLQDYLDKWAPGWRGFVFSKALKVDAGRLTSFSPAAILAANEAKKKAADDQKAREAAEAKARAAAKEGAAGVQRATMVFGGSVIIAGAAALWYVNRKKRNG